MFSTTRRRFISAGLVTSAVIGAMAVSPAVLLFAWALFALVGIAALGLWGYDWCLQGDEDIDAARELRDREHARQLGIVPEGRSRNETFSGATGDR